VSVPVCSIRRLGTGPPHQGLIRQEFGHRLSDCGQDFDIFSLITEKNLGLLQFCNSCELGRRLAKAAYFAEIQGEVLVKAVDPVSLRPALETTFTLKRPLVHRVLPASVGGFSAGVSAAAVIVRKAAHHPIRP
jgi:hypothetical protein